MTRWEFMRKLEELLSDIAPSEREEALQYYNDYLNDAGSENEEEALKELGSPDEVAKIVKEGLGITCDEKAAEKKDDSANGKAGAGQTVNMAATPAYHDSKDKAEKKKNDLPTWGIVLIVIGCIILIPVIFPLASAIIATVLGIICSILGMILGFGIAAVILAVVSVFLIILGFTTVVASPVLCVALIGVGFICMALAVAFMLLTVFLCGVVIPAIGKGISYLWKKAFGKKEEK